MVICSAVLNEWITILMRSVPGGTVGDNMGRVSNPVTCMAVAIFLTFSFPGIITAWMGVLIVVPDMRLVWA